MEGLSVTDKVSVCEVETLFLVGCHRVAVLK